MHTVFKPWWLAQSHVDQFQSQLLRIPSPPTWAARHRLPGVHSGVARISIYHLIDPIHFSLTLVYVSLTSFQSVDTKNLAFLPLPFPSTSACSYFHHASVHKGPVLLLSPENHRRDQFNFANFKQGHSRETRPRHRRHSSSLYPPGDSHSDPRQTVIYNSVTRVSKYS
jgi:hypothetical protein